MHFQIRNPIPTSADKTNKTATPVVARTEDHAEDNCIGKGYVTSSAEKPLASRNPYLAHLQQKQTISNVPLVQPAVHHRTKVPSSTSAIGPSSTAAKIALSPRDATQVSGEKAVYAQEMSTKDDTTSDDDSLEQDLLSLSKHSDESMLAYSESEAGSIFSVRNNVIGKNENSCHQPISVPEDQSFDGKVNRLQVLDSNQLHVKSLCDSVASEIIDQLLAPSPVNQLCSSRESEQMDKLPLESENPETVSYAVESKAQTSPNNSDGIAKEAGRQLSAALQWWQMNYAQNQDQNVNKLVEDALTRLSSAEVSQTKAPTTGSLQHRESGKSGDEDCQSFATDEGSIFSGLDDVVKSNSIAGDEVIGKTDAVLDCPPSSYAPISPPPPPLQKHVGEVLDQYEVVDTVNSDITSSVIAVDGVRDSCRSMQPSAMIKEEESVDVNEENDTDRSDKGGKSRSSHKTSTTGLSTAGNNSKLSGTLFDFTGAPTVAVLNDKQSNASQSNSKTAAPDKSCEFFRKTDSGDASEAEGSTAIPLFQCRSDGLKLESADKSIKAVFMKFGHSLLDRFETACRGQGEYNICWWPTLSKCNLVVSFSAICPCQTSLCHPVSTG